MKPLIYRVLSASLGLAAIGGCDLLPHPLYRAYTATCQPGSEADLRSDVKVLAQTLSEQLGLPVKTTADSSDLFVLVIDLPLIPDVPSYRPNSSGQIILSRTKDKGNSDIAIVVFKEPQNVDEYTKTILNYIEADLRG